MYVNTTGLILREIPYKDSSKILTVMTASEGRLTVSAHGYNRKNNKIAAVTQLLVFSEMTLQLKRDRWTLIEARSVEQFIGLRSDIVLLALGAYFAELIEALSDEDSHSVELLPLCLNALYALSEQIKPPALIKSVFELRLMAISGFMPNTNCCISCGDAQPERCFLDVYGGSIRCSKCGSSGLVLSKGALNAIRYIISCDRKKLFSFSLGQEAQNELITAAEGYLLAQLDRSFRTLDYYQGVKCIL